MSSAVPAGDAGFAAEAHLAARLRVPLAAWSALSRAEISGDAGDPAPPGLTALVEGRPHTVLSAGGSERELEAKVLELRRQGMAVAIAPPFVFEAAVERLRRTERMEEAIYGLLKRSPVSSAGSRMWLRQVVAAGVAVGVIGSGLSVGPEATLGTLAALVAFPFLCITLLRLAALRESLRFPSALGEEAAHGVSGPAEDADLPAYSVLVPLFREVNVLGGLVQSLRALDYPAGKLEVFLILEADDLETQAAVLALSLPAHFRTIIVPDRAPQTKPKALNYALQFARGEFVVVYDAEDRPEPDQLRRALALFRNGPPELGCVQAQLNIYNPRTSWLTRGIMAQTPQEMNPLAA